NQKLGLPLRNLSHELISACKRINGVSEVLKDDRVDASVFVKVSKVQLQGFRLRGTIPRIFSYISQCVVRLFSFFESQRGDAVPPAIRLPTCRFDGHFGKGFFT